MFLENKGLIVATAPRGFGKSTILDMVKKFFEIIPDDKGEPQTIETTENYRLFTNNSLQISKHPALINTHLGRYAVLYIDFKPLSQITGFTNMFHWFRIIFNNTVSRHTYLFQSQYMGINDRLYLKMTCATAVNHDGTFNVHLAFSRLIFYLNIHFNKGVVVLIDNYDAHVESLIFKNMLQFEIMRCMDYITTFYETLLRDTHVFRVLMTGVLKVYGNENRNLFNREEMGFFRYLYDNSFSKFYSLSESEVDGLLAKLIPRDDAQRLEVKRFISLYYNGDRYMTQNVVAFSWSVLRYLRNKNHAVSQFRSDYLKRFLPIFEIPEVMNEVKDLLQNKSIHLISKRRFAGVDVGALQSLITFKKVSYSKRDRFFYFLNEHGYVSSIRGSRLIISNEENRIYFKQIVDLVNELNPRRSLLLN